MCREPWGTSRVHTVHRLLGVGKTQRPVSAHRVRTGGALRRKELPRTNHLTGCRTSGSWGNGLKWGLGSGSWTERGTTYKPGLSIVVQAFRQRWTASWIGWGRVGVGMGCWLCPATTLLNLCFKRVNKIRHATSERHGARGVTAVP